jgi:hypothetical protein
MTQRQLKTMLRQPSYLVILAAAAAAPAQGGGLLALALAVTALSVLTFRPYQKSV